MSCAYYQHAIIGLIIGKFQTHWTWDAKAIRGQSFIIVKLTSDHTRPHNCVNNCKFYNEHYMLLHQSHSIFTLNNLKQTLFVYFLSHSLMCHNLYTQKVKKLFVHKHRWFLQRTYHQFATISKLTRRKRMVGPPPTSELHVNWSPRPQGQGGNNKSQWACY